MRNLCVVFDLDDTLYLERDYVKSGFATVARWAENTLELVDFEERAWRLFEKGERQSIFQNVLTATNNRLDPRIIRKMIRLYRNHVPEITLLPDAERCLSKLKDKVILAVITDGRLMGQQAKCASLRLSTFMDLIVCTEQWGKSYCKPHPRAYETLESHCKLPAGRLVYVGDNPVKDFTTPLERGWYTIRVRRPQGLHFSVDSPCCVRTHVEVADLWELPRILEMLSRRTDTCS
jgi:putative hydrolase of the HAD superfamily